jgi:hypothetical protein
VCLIRLGIYALCFIGHPKPPESVSSPAVDTSFSVAFYAVYMQSQTDVRLHSTISDPKTLKHWLDVGENLCVDVQLNTKLTNKYLTPQLRPVWAVSCHDHRITEGANY